MKTLIRDLRQLQEVDKRRIESEKERRKIIERVEHLEAMLKELERELEEKKEKLRDAERWYDERERELKEDNEKIKRAQGRLATITKAREYTMVQREIEALRRTNAQREEEMLKLLSVMDEFRAAIEEEEKKLAEMRGELEKEREASRTLVEELEANIESLGQQRADCEARIPSPVLKQYKRIQQAWQGLAVVPVNAKGSCGGCHRQIPPQTYNLLLKAESLQTCPFCNRFIYAEVMEEDSAESS